MTKHHHSKKKCDPGCDCTPCKGKKMHHHKGKRKMNAFMTKLNAARKSGAKSFKYNDATYKRATTKTGMVIFKKA